MEDFCDGWHGRYNGISIKIQFTIVGGGDGPVGKILDERRLGRLQRHNFNGVRK